MDLKLLGLLQSRNGSGGAKSWNDLEDRPFGSEVKEGILEFNGDYENYPLCEEYDMTLVKISDRALSREELLGAECTICIDTDVYYDPRGTYTFTVDEQSLSFNQVVEDEFNNYSLTDYSVYYKGMTALISVSEISEYAPTKLEIGTYFRYRHYGEGSIYVKSISCLTGDVENVDKIDPKYLPEVRFNDLKDRPCGVNIVDGVEKVRQLDKKFMPTLRYTDLADTPCKLRGIPVEYSGNLEDYTYYDVTGGSKIQCFVKISEKTYSKYELANASCTKVDRSGNETVTNIDKALIEEVLDDNGDIEMLRVRMADADNHNIVVVFKETTWESNTFEVGTYIAIFGLASTNVKSVSCVTEGFEVLQPLPEEVLPDSVATKDYVDELILGAIGGAY